MACPYTQPAKDATLFPFLMVEMQSEAAGGHNLCGRESSCRQRILMSVNALLWLLREAGTSTYESSSMTDTIAFQRHHVP